MKNEFLNFLDALMEASPSVVEERMTDNVATYISILRDNKAIEKPVLTETGGKVLKCMQDNANIPVFKAKEIADIMGVSSRGVSGSLRKLVTDGFCEKIANNPSVYTLTEKGKNFVIEGENE